jgi:hypothetical protein
MTDESIGTRFRQSAIIGFRDDKSLADRAIAQVSDADLRRPLPGDVNSIAIIMKHMAGNMISRWTEFLSSDGEKPWRHRDREFIDEFASRAEIIEHWERGWSTLFDTLNSLTADDLLKTVTVRGEPHTVIDAIHRQLAHYGYHVGQIVLIARIHVGEENWKTLTIPRGGSEQFNRSKGYQPHGR